MLAPYVPRQQVSSPANPTNLEIIMTVIITKHAKKRMKQRLGIRSKQQKSHASKAFKDGEIIQPLKNNTRILIKHKGYEYIFGLSKQRTCPVLITVY